MLLFDKSRDLSLTTIKLECITVNNRKKYGTGFFFSIEQNGEKVDLLVTNKHVIKNTIGGKFSILVATKIADNPEYMTQELDLTSIWNNWILHPDETIDLCALPTTNFVDSLRELGKSHHGNLITKILPLTENDIPNLGLNSISAIEDVIIIGYPLNIWDEKNNKPIIKRGITATDFLIDYNREPKFLIDAAIFPGSSGSPVLIYNYSDKKLANTVFLKNPFYFIGIVSSVFMYNAKNNPEIVPIPTVVNEDDRIMFPTNIAIAIKSHKLLDFKTLISWGG